MLHLLADSRAAASTVRTGGGRMSRARCPNPRAYSSSAQVVFMALATMSACSAPEQFWTCEVVTEGPVLSISAVRDSSTGALLPEVRIGNIVANGHPFAPDMRFLLIGPGAHGATIEEKELICRPECAFGYESGPWQMTFSQEGYRPQTMSLVAEYSRKETTNHCEVHQSGAVHISVLMPRLDP